MKESKKSISSSRHGYESIDDVGITLHAELDQQTVSFETLMNLKVGSVLGLRRPTGENVDLFAGDVYIGSGEILIVESTLAIRIADLKEVPVSAPDIKSE